MEDLVERLGSVPLARIVAWPPPGMATEEDLLREPAGRKRLCELVDGVLVEKPMATYESMLAAILIRLLGRFLDAHDIGTVTGADGLLRLADGLVRAPDVSFISWDHFPGHELPADPIFNVAPDLAVEILSPSNTAGEMDRKLSEYFAAGTRLVWIMDPVTWSVRVYTSPVDCSVCTVDGELDGGDVLPGFHLSVREWMDRAGRRKSS
jgi:Uma2 family endonuclease